MQCITTLHNRIPNREEPTQIFSSLISLLKLTSYYGLVTGNGAALLELVKDCSAKAAEMMSAGMLLENFQHPMFQRIGGDQRYRE